jgi:CheY-like chemotaxis protein
MQGALPGVTSARTEGLATISHLGLNVLIVEENTVDQEVIGQLLRQLGCRTRLASSAIEGLCALCEQSFDLVLMDIQMPTTDGIAALHEFRRGTNGRYRFTTARDTPVVAVTSHARDGDEQRLIDLGFDDHLPRPFRQNQLKAMLNRTMKPVCAARAEDAAPTGAAGPAALGAGSVLDPQALQRLRELDPTGQNNLLERVFKAFDSSVLRLLPQLRDAHRRGDNAGVRHVVHTLKSSTASIGANRLSRQCAEIEGMIRLDDTSELDARVQAMMAEAEVVLQEVRRGTGETS